MTVSGSQWLRECGFPYKPSTMAPSALFGWFGSDSVNIWNSVSASVSPHSSNDTLQAVLEGIVPSGALAGLSHSKTAANQY